MRLHHLDQVQVIVGMRPGAVIARDPLAQGLGRDAVLAADPPPEAVRLRIGDRRVGVARSLRAGHV